MDIDRLAAAAELLGAGVWGEVYDAGESTVLKLAKEQGGIGSGREKVLHEKRMMEALAPYTSGLSYAIPRVLGCGDIPADSERGRQGYAIWLHSSKVPGAVLKVRQIEETASAGQKIIARALALALAEFHRVLENPPIAVLLKPDSIADTVRDQRKIFTPEDARRADRVLQLTGQVPERDLRPIHGDFNISNVLFERQAVSGVIDFAEMCLGSVEDDICSLTSELPFLRESIIAEYEAFNGRPVDRNKLFLAEMKRNLIGLLICRYRLNRPEEALENEKRIDAALREGGVKAPVPSRPTVK